MLHARRPMHGTVARPALEKDSRRERERTVNNNIFPCSVLQLWALIAFGACMGFWTLALPHVWPALKALFRLFWILKAVKEIATHYCALPLEQ